MSFKLDSCFRRNQQQGRNHTQAIGNLFNQTRTFPSMCDREHQTLSLSRPLGNISITPKEERRRLLARRGYIGVSNINNCPGKVHFAAVGDVHGQFSLLSKKLEETSQKHGITLDFVLQVGDIECHRHEEDLASMAAPAKKRTLGDFWKSCQHDNFYLEQHPMYFIGGNHECYGWLDNESHYQEREANKKECSAQEAFLEVAPNVFYLGRAGYLPLRFYRNLEQSEDDNIDLDIVGILNLGFLSGIHRPPEYYHRRPAMTNDTLSQESNRRWIRFNVYDTQLLLEDEEDDGIDHPGRSFQATTGTEAKLDKHWQLMVTLAKLLGVHLGKHVTFECNILLSAADVKLLTRYLVPATPGANAEDLETKRRNAAETLPRTLDGIARVLMKERDIQKMIETRLKRKRAVDVFLTHDWPSGVADEAKMNVVGKRSRPVGNSVCRELTNSLKPKVHCCGHMHRGYRYQIQHTTPSGKPLEKRTDLCCLGKVGLSGPAAIAIFEFDLETGALVEVGKDAGLCKLGSFEEDEDEDA